MEKELFIALKSKINTELPEIKTVGLWNNQFIRQEEEENKQNPFRYPAVFIEFSNYSFRDLGKRHSRADNTQEFDFTLSTYLGFKSLKDEDVEILDLKGRLHSVVRQFQQGYFAKLQRVSQRPDYDHGNVQVFVTEYQGYGKDYAEDERTETTLTLSLSASTTFTGVTSQY